MSILKQYTNVQGITLGYHRVVQIVVEASGAKALVQSWPGKEQYEALANTGAPMPRGIVEVAVPLFVLAEADPIAAVETYLVSFPDSPFVNGTIETDANALETAKTNKLRSLLTERDSYEFAGVNVPDIGVIGTDSNSQRLLTGTAVLAMFAMNQGHPFSVEWTLKDGVSVVTLDVQKTAECSVAVGLYVSSVYVAHRSAVAAVEAATTVEEVNTVRISLT